MGGGVVPQAITGHLVWAGDGSVWACLAVEPFSYPHRSVGDATDIHARTQAALLALPDRSLIVSVTHRLSPTEVTRRIASASGSSPAWAAYATGTAAGAVTHERMWVLAVRLPDDDRRRGWLDRLRVAASHTTTAGFGGAATPPTRAAVTRALQRAAALEERLAAHIDVAPMSSRRVRWLFEHTVTRGLTDMPLPAAGDERAVSVRRLDRDCVYVEGGRRRDPGRPRHWRYLTVEHPDLGVGYQTFLCLGELPGSWSFPYGSGEWLWHLDDQLPFPVDWAVTVERVDNETARRRVMRARRNLTGQLDEPGGDPAGPSTTIGAASDAVDEVRSRLEANPQLPIFRATTIVAVAHRDLEVVERRAAMVETVFRAAEFNFYRPTGGQLACLAAMLPGAAPAPVVAEYGQDLLPDGLASAMPFAGCGVGDPGGLLLGVCLDTPTARPVFLDPAHPPRDLNRSGSLAAVGELGSGKSFLAKTLTHATVAMGGQVVAVDRTERGEYAALATVVPGTAQVVEISGDARVCLDPFRVFDTDELRLRYGVGFVTLVTGTAPGSAAGALCHRATHAALTDAATGGRPPRLADMIDDLAAAGGAGIELADQLAAMAGVAEARLVFGDPGPPVDLAADYVCFHAPGLRLPRRGVPRSELLPEELIGQAVLYLIAAFSRRVLFTHPHRFAALLLDESHAVTANPQGRALVTELIRDGRKHFAAVWAFTQLATDLTHTTDTDDPAGLDALLGYRVVFRQPRHTAADALAFLGSDDREANIDTICGFGTGECLLRDPTGRLGVVRIAAPDDPALLAALTTTPTGTDQHPTWGPWPSLHTTATEAGNGHRSASTSTFWADQ